MCHEEVVNRLSACCFIWFVPGLERFRQTLDHRVPRALKLLLGELTRCLHVAQVLKRETTRSAGRLLVEQTPDDPDCRTADQDDTKQRQEPGQELAEQCSVGRGVCECQRDAHKETLRSRAHLLPVFFDVFLVVVFLEVFFDVFFVVAAAPVSAAMILFHSSAGISSMLALAITRSAAFCS